MMVKYDPRNLSQIWVIDEAGPVIGGRYRDLSYPRIALWESRRARKEWQDKNIGRMTEGALFRIIDAQRRLAETARQQTRSARLEVERDVRQPKNKTQRDPKFAPDPEVVEDEVAETTCFLPVEIMDQPQTNDMAPKNDAQPVQIAIEIDIAGGHQLRIVGSYDPEALVRLICGLST